VTRRLRASQSRQSKRFEIRCPVTVKLLRKRGKGTETHTGLLYNIAEGGARFGMEEPLPEGSPVTLYVHLPNPAGRETTLRFEGIVTRVKEGPRYDIVVQFRSNGRFVCSKLRDQLGD
jgi:hypothetical protein